VNNEDKCPHCNASVDQKNKERVKWICGTFRMNNWKLYRSQKCGDNVKDNR